MDTLALIAKAKLGDKTARDQVITENVGLVWSTVRRFLGRGYEADDLFQIGSIGLMKAMEQLAHQLGRDATLEEIASATELTIEDIVMAMEANVEVESIYKSVYQSDGNEIYLVDKIPESKDENEILLNHMLLEQLMEELNETERELIQMRYFQDKTQMEVAKKLGVSQVQVSRMEKKILIRMRAHLIG